MRFGVARINFNGLKKERDSFLRAVFVNQETAQIYVGSGILGHRLLLPGDRLLVCRSRFFVSAKPRKGQTQIIICFYIPGIELQTLLESADGFGKAVLVVFCAAQIVPTVGIIRSPLEHLGQPLVGVGVVCKNDIVEGNNLQIGG